MDKKARDDMVSLKLSEVEARHILTYIEQNETEGWYFGNREQYEKRLRRIKAKILYSLDNAKEE